MAERVESNWMEFGRHLWRPPAVELHQEADLAWYASAIPSPLVNGVYRAQLAGDVEGRIREVLALFRTRNNPMVWWIGPSTQPRRLGRRLLAHGLYREDDEAGMFCTLAVPAEPETTGAGLRIVEIADRDALAAWHETMAAGFELQGLSKHSLLSVEGALPCDDPAYHRYLALLDGVPVATGALFVSEGVAGLYNIATLPHARRRGIGSALTSDLLRRAREASSRLAILTASEMARSTYERLGFRVCCTFEQYIFDPVTVLPDD